jgi:hypothetical protein
MSIFYGNNLITNTVEKYTIMLQVELIVAEFTTQEIGLAVGQSFALNDIVGISETITEIRAAMAGFDSFYGFIFGVMSDAKNNRKK